MTNKNEKKFFNALNDIFVGAKIEGKSGYINLMRIKSKYYTDFVFPALEQDINSELTKISNDKFREELFEKMYDFFKRYFSENGSIYFNFTPANQDIYEKVYTNEKDVILFWKTHMLYYVKTDMIFKNLKVSIDDYDFNFDVSNLEHKKSNEKREVIFDFAKTVGKNIFFDVTYSERGRKTKIGDILKQLKKSNIEVSEENLLKAFQVFKKQNEVDYFINKNAKQFLQEQFDMWLYHYTFKGENIWNEPRIKELQVLKSITYKIIDFISQFEDELVKIWNKPKFVLNSNYVISLKTLKEKLQKKDYEKIELIVFDTLKKNPYFLNELIDIIKEIYKKPLQKIYINNVEVDFNNNVFRLDYIKAFKTQNELNNYLKKHNLKEIKIDKFYDGELIITGFWGQYSQNNIENNIPFQEIYFDTKHFDIDFKLTVLKLLSTVAPLDNLIDGRLIKSENYQTLNTIQEKFKNKIQLIYIDPPFNTEGAGFVYCDKFKDSTWLSFLNDRISLAKTFLKKSGSFYLHLDHNCNFMARQLCDNIFKQNYFNREIIWNTSESPSGFKTQAKNFIRQHDTIFYYSIQEKPIFNKLWVVNQKHSKVPTVLGWMDLFEDEKGYFVLKYKVDSNSFQKEYIEEKVETIVIGDIWNDIYSMMYTQNMTRENWGKDNTQKPENLLRRIIQSSSNENDYILDFFLGSGTSIVASHKLKRKWIGIEMGSYFDDVILRRIKTVIFGDKRPKLTEDLNWRGGGIVKYYELEQYEETLKKVNYKDADLYNDYEKDPYNHYVFMKDLKMLDAVEADYKKNKIKIDLSKLYENIDIPETLSNLTGKWIKSIDEKFVIFDDGTKIDYTDLDYKLIKKLIWWE